jgi:hypothetical protein
LKIFTPVGFAKWGVRLLSSEASKPFKNYAHLQTEVYNSSVLAAKLETGIVRVLKNR